MNKNMTLTDYLNKRLAPQSVKNYLYTIDNFLKLHPRAKRYKYQQMVDHLAEVRKKYPKNIQTSIRILSAIKKYYDYLVYTGQREDHPCQTLTVKKGSDQSIQLQYLFSSTELEALMQRENRYKHLESRNKVILSLLIYQGLTSNEITRLDVDNVDLDMGQIYIKASSKQLRRTLPLKANQVSLFMRYINDTRPEMQPKKTHKLIITKLGQPITVDSINAMVEPLRALYPDRDLNPRAIRMSVIANLLNEKRATLEEVQRFAGHKWIGTTQKYFKSNSAEQREMINRFFPL